VLPPSRADGDSLPACWLNRWPAGEKAHMNTRTIAIAALVIAVILLLVFLL
jgi:hypothetical protein